MKKFFALFAAFVTMMSILVVMPGGAEAISGTDSGQSPSISLTPVSTLDGDSFTVSWDDSRLDPSSVFVFITASDIENDSTWRYSYLERTMHRGALDLSILGLTASSYNIAVVPVADDLSLLFEPVWSDTMYSDSSGLTLVEPVQVFSKSSEPTLSGTSSSSTAAKCLLDTPSAGCTEFAWSDSPDGFITDLWGFRSGIDISNNNGGSWNSFAGAYTRSSGHKFAENGNTGVERNPYGLGFCIDEVAAAGTGDNPQMLPNEPDYWNQDAVGVLHSGVTNQNVANWIITHFGQPGVFDISPASGITTWTGSEDVGVSLDHMDGGVTLDGIPYNEGDRLAASHLAIRKSLVIGYPGGDGEIRGVTAEEDDIVALANRMWGLAAIWATAAPEGIKIDPSASEPLGESNPGVIVVEVTDGLDNPMEGVAVKIEEGSISGNIVISPASLTQDSGEGSAQHQYDSFDFSKGSLGGSFTNASGLAFFDFTRTGEASVNFFVDAAGSDAVMWGGATSGSVSSGKGQRTVAAGEIVSAEQGIEFSQDNNLTLVKRDGDGNILPGAEFHITSPNDTDVIDFAYQVMLGREIDLPSENADRDYWVGVLNADGISEVLTIMATTPEWTGAGNPGTLSNQAFIDYVYDEMLGRSPDATGNAFWLAHLGDPGSTGRVGLVSAFFDTSEHWTHRGNEGAFRNELFSGVTDANGEINLTALDSPYVSVYEVSAPAGYEMNTVNRRRGLDLGLTRSVTYVNVAEVSSTFRIRKVDELGDPVEGAVFDVYFDSTGDGTYNELLFNDVVSGSDGWIPIVDVESGDYLLIEVGAPTGFELAPPVEFTVSPNETVEFDFENRVPLSISTVAEGSSFVLDASGEASVFDTAFVGSLADGERGVVTTRLFGPFDSVADMVEDDAFLVCTVTDDVVGTSAVVDEFDSSECTVSEVGVYTFVEFIVVDDDPNDGFERTAVHDFGDDEETFTVSERDLGITTVVGSSVFELDASGEVTIFDTAFVTGLAEGEEAVITTVLYGPFDSVADMVEDDAFLVCTVTDDVVGTSAASIEVDSSGCLITEVGVYTFVESVAVDRDDDGTPEREADHEFGDTDETFTITERELGITTVAEDSTFEVDADGVFTVYDTAFVTGLAEGEEAVITTVLYGPFDSVEDMVQDTEHIVCTVTDTVVGTSAEVDEFQSSPCTITEGVGVYTFVESIVVDRDDDGTPEREADHEFGDTDETFTVTDRVFSIDTQVQAHEVPLSDLRQGDGTFRVYDLVTLAPVADVTGSGTRDGDSYVLDVELFGPFDSDDAASMSCNSSMSVGSSSVVITEFDDDGELFELAYVDLDDMAPGFYTFVASATLKRVGSADVVVSHECGLATETLLATPEDGVLVARKFNSRNTATVIAGGGYSVWMDLDSVPAGSKAAYLSAVKLTPADVTNPNELLAEDGNFGFVAEGVTGSDGLLTFTVPLGAAYVMVEETAPTGWIQDKSVRFLPPTDAQVEAGQRFGLLTKEISDANKAGTNDSDLLELPETATGDLPKTGLESGGLLAGGLGLMVLAGGGFLAVRRRRNSELV